MKLPHDFKRIRLNLARSKEFPNGSSRHGYEFVAPLAANGHIDTKLWQEHRDHCRVRRFWEGEDEQVGLLVHKPGGAEHARWVFDYDPSTTDDDESGYRFGSRGNCRALPASCASPGADAAARGRLGRHDGDRAGHHRAWGIFSALQSAR